MISCLTLRRCLAIIMSDYWVYPRDKVYLYLRRRFSSGENHSKRGDGENKPPELDTPTCNTQFVLRAMALDLVRYMKPIHGLPDTRGSLLALAFLSPKLTASGVREDVTRQARPVRETHLLSALQDSAKYAD